MTLNEDENVTFIHNGVPTTGWQKHQALARSIISLVGDQSAALKSEGAKQLGADGNPLGSDFAEQTFKRMIEATLAE